MKKLKVGLIIDNHKVSKSTYDLICALKKENFFFEQPVLLSQVYSNKNKFFFTNFFRRILRRMIVEIETFWLQKNPLFSQHKNTIMISNLKLSIIRIQPQLSTSGLAHTFSSYDLDQISNLNLDVLIRCGTGILKGKILTITKFGVLSFHHGDNREIRGMPAGFWEVFLKKPTTGFIIQQLTEELDNGNILMRGNIPTASYWQLNATRISYKSNIFLLNLLKEISITRKISIIEKPFSPIAKLYTSPSFFELLKYLFNTSFALVKNFSLRYLNYRHEWSVSFVSAEGLESNLSQGITIKNPKGRFLADPFIFSMGESDYCFLEDFSYSENKGKISCYKILEDGYENMGVALEENFHLSFPFIFEYENKIYMCPETAQINEIRLYECVSFPNKWIYKKTLIRDVSASDTIIFNSDSQWHLLTNICSSKIDDRLSELHLYTSDGILTDSWKKSSINPVIFDSQKARNGGFFELDGVAYRVNQFHDIGRYGTGISINKIDYIDTNFYQESKVFSIKANFFKNLSGVHHLHMNNRYCVYDHSTFKKIS